MNINVTHILDDFIRVACLADALSLSPLPLCYHHLPHFICPLNKLITFPIFNALYNFEHVAKLAKMKQVRAKTTTTTITTFTPSK